MSAEATPYAPPATAQPSTDVGVGKKLPLSLWMLGLTCAGVLATGLWLVPPFRKMFDEVGAALPWNTEFLLRATELPYLPLVVLLPLWVGIGLLRYLPKVLPWFTLAWFVTYIGFTGWALFSPLTELISPL